MRRLLYVAVAASLAALPLASTGSITSAIARGSGPHIRVNHSLPTSGFYGDPNVSSHPQLHASSRFASGLVPSTTSGEN